MGQVGPVGQWGFVLYCRKTKNSVYCSKTEILDNNEALEQIEFFTCCVDGDCSLVSWIPTPE